MKKQLVYLVIKSDLFPGFSTERYYDSGKDYEMECGRELGIRQYDDENIIARVTKEKYHKINQGSLDIRNKQRRVMEDLYREANELLK